MTNGHPPQLRNANVTLKPFINSLWGTIVAANGLIRSDEQRRATQLVCEGLFRSGIEV